MVRGPSSVRGLHGDQQVPGQAVCSPAGEDALGEQATLKYSDCWCIAWDMQLGSMDVVSGGPAGLSGAGLSPCLVRLFVFPVEASLSGKKSVWEDLVRPDSLLRCFHTFTVTE